MRRAGNLWPSVVAFTNLRRAARRASLGKRRAASVAPFLERLEFEVLELERQLTSGTWQPGPVHRFVIHDPKERTITVTPFCDQVVHHTLIAVLEPVFERRMIAHSYACRKHKGTHAALRYAQRCLRRHGWFLKLDVRAFFDSVAHATVLASLQRIVKDARVLALAGTILRGPPTDPSGGKGLPVGSLTSQWFANLVLDRLDHAVIDQICIRSYVRYMDDFVLFADDAATLRGAHDAVVRFLGDELGLELKARATILAPARQGLPFLGWQVFPGLMRPRPANLRRYLWRLRLRRWEVGCGRRSPESYRAAVAAIHALLAHGDTHRLRVKLWADDLDEGEVAP